MPSSTTAPVSSSPQRQAPFVVSPFHSFHWFLPLSSYPSFHTASDNPAADHSSIASSTASPPRSQNTPPWPFASHPSPSSSLPSPPSYQLTGHSNHPSPAASACSPTNMIGATPTYYDPELEAQPQTQDYQAWTSSYEQQFALANSSSYSHHPTTADSRRGRQVQQTTRHHNQYQFVPQQQSLSTTSDAAQYNYLNQFDDRPSHSYRRQHVTAAEAMQTQDTQGWSQPSNPAFSQPQSSDHPYLTSLITHPVNQYPSTLETHDAAQTQLQPPAGHITPTSAVTPVSDITLNSARISPAWLNDSLPSPGRTSSANTPTRNVVPPSSKRAGKSTPARSNNRKRHKAETDDDDEEDMMGLDANLVRPNRL